MTNFDIWKWGYFPFTFGGSTYRPIKTAIEVGEPVELGSGFQGYEYNAPDGSTIVAEATTGAVVGTSIAMVQKDIAMADAKIMSEQIADSKTQHARAKRVKLEEFFRF